MGTTSGHLDALAAKYGAVVLSTCRSGWRCSVGMYVSRACCREDDMAAFHAYGDSPERAAANAMVVAGLSDDVYVGDVSPVINDKEAK